MSIKPTEVELQRSYYAQTASTYEAEHVQRDEEHVIALGMLAAMIDRFDCRSVLDVGSGTGRGLHYLKKKFPDLKVIGIEPSAELREIGHRAGLGHDELIDGDALQLGFADGSFDIVCEFGVLHHIRTPRAAIAEMLRVARRGIFLSDDNHFASGSPLNCLTKRMFKRAGLWQIAYWMRTGGKGYGVSEGDGISYAYSVFDDLDFIEKRCARVFLTNTQGSGPDLYTSAPNVALYAHKS